MISRRRVIASVVTAAALLALWAWALAGRAVDLIRTGDGIGIALGAAIFLLPLAIVVFVGVELLLAAKVHGMEGELEAAGEPPVDDLPRLPSGRIDRDAARAALATCAPDGCDDLPTDWQGWYRLAFLYDATGDRRHAKAALRRAASLY